MKNTKLRKLDGAILAARHSFMPNRLGYCGPDENEVLFEACANNEPSKTLIDALREFKGAFPYLHFIAETHGTDNPFDYDVVEAYWIGNDLLERIPPDGFYSHLGERLKEKFTREQIKKLFQTGQYAPVPHHALHVFNAFSTMGTVPDSFANAVGPDDKVGQMMDKCRISWGRVVGYENGSLTVEYEPVIRREGRLNLGSPILTKVTAEIQGKSFVGAVNTGDWVSFHWGFACSVLTPLQVANLRKYTLADMAIANSVPVPQ